MKRDFSINGKPSVGIILTTFNGQDHLEDQMLSLLCQVDVNLHIYVFDDLSLDYTCQILERFSFDNPGKISIYRNVRNSGGTGLNIFNNLALVDQIHDYFAFADQDDVWLPNKLIRAIDVLRYKRADLYFSDLLAWDGSNGILKIVTKSQPLKDLDHVFGGGSAGCTYVLSKHFFAHVCKLIVETDISSVRRISHDWIIYFIARHYGYVVSASPDALIRYRIHAESQYGSMTLGGLSAILRKLKMLRAGFLREQVSNALLFTRENSEEQKIFVAFQKGIPYRIMVLFKYNFLLSRTKRRFFALAVASFFIY